jgi:hypothetical protein
MDYKLLKDAIIILPINMMLSIHKKFYVINAIQNMTLPLGRGLKLLSGFQSIKECACP